MVKSYNPDLRKILQATNPNRGVVLNAQFAKWEEHVADCLKNREKQSIFYRYTSAADKDLFKQAQEHVEQHRQESESDNAVVIVHPFYLPLTDKSKLACVDEFQTECNRYLERLVNFFRWQKEEADTTVVLFETLHHYAAASSLLLEQGLVDDVLFTYYDTGTLLNRDQNGQFRNKTIYAGGGYNDGCLLAALCDFVALPPTELYAIQDLTIEPPSRMINSNSIHPADLSFSYIKTFPKDHCFMTEEVKDKLQER